MSALKMTTLSDAIDELEALEIALAREKKAREKAEVLLENRASNMFKINQRLQDQYVNASKRNQENNYLLKITKLDVFENEVHNLFLNFLEISSMLLWAEASFAFKCDKKSQKLIPVTNFMINSDSNDQKEIENRFMHEDFCFLEIHFDAKKPLRFSNFLKDVSLINEKYSDLNYSYLFPVEIDQDEKYFLWFTFPNAIELDQSTIDLVDNGINQLMGTIQKYNSKKQLIENYKKLKEMKSQLIQSEKMASLGTISAGIAHEINNPLSFLLTNSEVLKEYMSTIIDYIKNLESLNVDSEWISKNKKNVDYILQDTPMLMNESLEGIDRIREIVNGLRTFSRADDGEIKEIDINTCVETSLRLVSNELKHRCKISKELNSKLNVKGSDGQLIQVFTNLLVNSAQAIDGFGSVEVTTKDINNTVVVSIKDSGKGISKENLDQLFTPFFTTKPTGQGTGLGLSISYGIIKKHNGNITVESTVGVGTIFHITLPVAQR